MSMDKIYSTLDKYWAIAVGLAIGCASILLSRDALIREFVRGIIPAVTIVAALATTLFLFVLYMNGARDELDLARTHKYIEHIRQPETEQVVIIILLAICFGGLIAFVTNLLVYMGLMICLQVTDLVGTYMVRCRFQDAEKFVPDPARDPLHDYYVVKPHLLLRSARLVACAVAMVFALMARTRPASIITVFGWATIIVAILSCEYVLHRWRQERKHRLAAKHGFCTSAG
jgi:hypothetical protein